MFATKIHSMPASDLIGRLAINPNGAEFVIVAVNFDARTGQVLVEIDEIDLDEHKRVGFPSGLFTMQGWEIGQHVPHVL